MILSNEEIARAIQERRIVIEPPPPTASLEIPNSPYDSTALDLRLGKTISIPKGGKPFSFDLRRGGIAPFLREIYKTQEINPEGGFSLQPGRFALSSTLERIKLPIESGYAARVEGRSSFARCGLIVHFTAPTIHAGFEGTITLELKNLGEYPIVLYPDMPICQIIFEKVEGKVVFSPSQFQDQTTPEGE